MKFDENKTFDDIREIGFIRKNENYDSSHLPSVFFG